MSLRTRGIWWLMDFTMPPEVNGKRPPIQQLYAALEADGDRKDLIFDNVLQALEAGRSPLLLTERNDHAHCLADRLGRFARNVLVSGSAASSCSGSTLFPGRRNGFWQPRAAMSARGLTIARLDTLFLAMPISWRGTLAQYVGRLHRLHAAKREVRVYDYVDNAAPVLRRMSAKRVRGYEGLGHIVEQTVSTPSPETAGDDLMGHAIPAGMS